MKPLAPLPIGLQSFERLRETGCLYVDKTQYLCNLAERQGYFFLPRPRRFGKSLAISTLSALFSGKKELFLGLFAEKNWAWEKKYPVLLFSMNTLSYDEIGLAKALHQELDSQAELFGLSLQKEGLGARFLELIQKLSNQAGKVVVLIDEYDKPLIDYLEKERLHRALEHRDILRNFYGVLKDADAMLRFVFVTGISKFGRMSIFSQLNNLYDISIDQRFATLLGYTQAEMHQYFTPYLEAHLPKLDLDLSSAWEKIKLWYNGYTWDTVHYVYNPFSILQFMESGQFQNYWFRSGGPKFLVDLLKENALYAVEQQEAVLDSLDAYDLERIDPTVLLYQTGYLTLGERNEWGIVKLVYPNKEVRDSLNQFLLGGYANLQDTQAYPTVFHLSKAFQSGKTEVLAQALSALFASFPYDLIVADREKHFQAVVYLAFRLMGAFVQTEVKTADGRMDAVVYTHDKIWILEFKLDASAEVALQQIKEKRYADSFLAGGKTIVMLGINFSSQTRKMDGFCFEIV